MTSFNQIEISSYEFKSGDLILTDRSRETPTNHHFRIKQTTENGVWLK